MIQERWMIFAEVLLMSTEIDAGNTGLLSRDKRNIAIVLAYDGTDFSGWQRLGGGARTVQKTLEEALSSVLCERINVIGSGRTDAGVHAEGQCANFWTSVDMPRGLLVKKLDARLPPDLCCVGARVAKSNFHARYRVKTKTYAYRFHDGPVRDPFEARWSFHTQGRLDEAAMEKACAAFVGTHDFRAFSNAKEDAKDFVRNIVAVDVKRSGDLVELYVSADGFLYNQVRIMAACALAAGLGSGAQTPIAALLESAERSSVPGALGAYGLRLLRVLYDDDDFLDAEPER
jgi:tRNA pseudouridine38-40 synthase